MCHRTAAEEQGVVFFVAQVVFGKFLVCYGADSWELRLPPIGMTEEHFGRKYIA